MTGAKFLKMFHRNFKIFYSKILQVSTFFMRLKNIYKLVLTCGVFALFYVQVRGFLDFMQREYF